MAVRDATRWGPKPPKHRGSRATPLPRLLRFALLIAPWLLSGCYLAHIGAERADGGARLDAGSIDAGSRDAGAPDAGTRDAGSGACRLVPLGEAQVRDTPTHSSHAPDLVWTGSELRVAMMEGDGDIGHPIVTVASVSPDLARVGEAMLAGEEAHGWGEIAWSGDALGLCWSGDPGGEARTMFRRGLEGGMRGPRVDLDPDGEACLDLAYLDGRWMAALRHREETPEGPVIETRALVLDAEGTPIGEPLTLARDAYPGRNAQLAIDGDRFLAALSPANGVVQLIEISRDGRVVGDPSFDVPDARGAVVAADRGRRALLVAIGPAEVRRLGLLVLDDRSRPLGAMRVLTDGAPSALHPTIAALPDGWLVVWTDEHEPSNALTLLHLDRDGAPREPRILAHAGPTSSYGGPSIAIDGASAYVAYARDTATSGFEQMFVEGWRCAPEAPDLCAPQEIVEGDCDSAERVRWRWTGADCVPVLCPSACSGPDCDRLAASAFACRSDHPSCMTRSCPEVEVLTRTCASSRVVNEPEYAAFRVDAVVDCPCATELRCDVRVVEPFRIALDVSACPLPVACGCGPPGEVSATCHLPALSAGTWTVEPPGLAPFPFEVRPPWEPIMDRPRFCTDDE